MLLLIAYYLTAFDPRRNPFDPEGTEPATTTSWEPNPIDVMVLDFIRKKCASRWMTKHYKRLGDCLVAVRNASGPSTRTTLQAPDVSDAHH